MSFPIVAGWFIIVFDKGKFRTATFEEAKKNGYKVLWGPDGIIQYDSIQQADTGASQLSLPLPSGYQISAPG